MREKLARGQRGLMSRRLGATILVLGWFGFAGPPGLTATGPAQGATPTAGASAASVASGGAIGNRQPGRAAGEPITLADARDRALAANPGLATRALEVRAVEGATRQARAWPNPEIAVEVEDFGRDLPKWSDSQTTWSLSQRVEFPMAWFERLQAGRGERRAARLDYERSRLDLIAEVDRRFGDLLAEQARLEMTREGQAIADTLYLAVSALVAAGEVSPIEEDRARAVLSRAGIAVKRAESAVTKARSSLGALWADPGARDLRAAGALEEELTSIATVQIDSLASDLPDLAWWDAVVSQSSAELRSRQWSRLPVVTLGGGLRRTNGPGTEAWVASAAIDLPLWDRNGGAVAEAAARAAQGRIGREAERARIIAERRVALEAVESAQSEVRTYRDTTRPEVRRAYEAVSEGYRRGKFPLIDLLDARRTLAETELAYIDALQQLRSARIELERLLGSALRTNGGEIR